MKKRKWKKMGEEGDGKRRGAKEEKGGHAGMGQIKMLRNTKVKDREGPEDWKEALLD